MFCKMHIFGCRQHAITRRMTEMVCKSIGCLLEMVNNTGSLGGYTCPLGCSLENALVEHAIKFQQMPYGFTTTEFRELVFKIAEKIGVDHPFRKNIKMLEEIG